MSGRLLWPSIGLVLLLSLVPAAPIAPESAFALEALYGEGVARSPSFAPVAQERFARVALLRDLISPNSQRMQLGVAALLNYEAPEVVSSGGRAGWLFDVNQFFGFGMSFEGARLRMRDIRGPARRQDALFLYLEQTGHWNGPPDLFDFVLGSRRRATVVEQMDVMLDLRLQFLSRRTGGVYLKLSLGIARPVVPPAGGLASAAFGLRTPQIGRTYFVVEAYARRISSLALRSPFGDRGGSGIADTGVQFGLGVYLGK